LPRVEEALLLIRTYDPVSYRRVTHELERVRVFVVPGSAAVYRESLGTCQVDERYVRDSSAEFIASTIVHEATHARLARCGIAYEQKHRVRIERVCTRRQIAFAAKLPNGEEACEQAQDQLAGFSPEVFTNQAFAEREDRGGVEALRYLGVPEWLIRAILRVRNARIAFGGGAAGATAKMSSNNSSLNHK